MMQFINKYRYYFIGCTVWLLAIASIYVVAELKFPKKPKLDVDLKSEQRIIAKLFDDLSEVAKIQMNYYESGFIRLSDGQYHLINNTSDEDELQLIKKGLLIVKNLPQNEIDPLLAERRYRIQSAYRQLNTAEHVCLLYKQAVLFYRDENVYLAINPHAYKEYVEKFGDDCPSCDEKEKVKSKKKGGE